VNQFRGNDFSAADLEDVGFVGGIDLDQQRLPTGPQYVRLDRPLARIAKARPMVERWEPGEAREEALILLEVYSGGGVEEQGELFANRWETGAPHDVCEQFWRLLESIELN
jgi:hypothetical protein